MNFYGSNKAVAQFAADLLMDSRFVYASITITVPRTSGDCSVRIVTDMSLEDIVSEKAKIYFSPPTTTSPENTQDG